MLFNGFCVSEGAMFIFFRFFFRFVFGIDVLSFFCLILGSFWEAFGSQKQTFLALIFCVNFWSFFGPILRSSWEAFWRLWGIEIGHFGHRFLDDFGMALPERPKSVQERPNTAAKRGPRAAKSGPEGPKAAFFSYVAVLFHGSRIATWFAAFFPTNFPEHFQTCEATKTLVLSRNSGQLLAKNLDNNVAKISSKYCMRPLFPDVPPSRSDVNCLRNIPKCL